MKTSLLTHTNSNPTFIMKNLSEGIFFEKCGLTVDRLEFYENFSWWVGGVISLFISVAGMILNGIAVCILCNKRVAPCLFDRLLISLAVLDNLFLTTTIFDAFKDQLTKPLLTFDLAYIFVNIMYPVRSISMCASIYMTIGLSFERYIFLARPLYDRARHNTKVYSRLLLYITSTVTFSFLYSIPKFLDLKITEISNCEIQSKHHITLRESKTQNCTPYFDIIPTEIRLSPYYILWYINVSNLAVTSLCPGILLAFFNYKIYKILKENEIQRALMIFRRSTRNEFRENIENSKDHRRTFILFCIVALFVVCHALRMVMNIEELSNLTRQTEGSEQCPLRYWAMMIIPVSSLLIQVNAGANFFIYCQFDKTFREIFLATIYRFNKINTNTRTRRDTFRLQEGVILKLQEKQ